MTTSRSSFKILKPALACLVAAMVGWPLTMPSVAAAEAVEAGRPILPGEKQCHFELPPHRDWTEQEKWAWTDRICLGEIADMSRYGNGYYCDPEKADEWPETSDLSSEFLATILNHEPYRSALTRAGVRIRCARFNEAVDLSNMVIAHPLWLDASRFRRTVDLSDLLSSRLISLEGSVFDGLFDAEGLELTGSLYMRGGAQFKEVVLRNAKIGSNLETDGSIFDGRFNADSLEVAGYLFMRAGAQFKEVVLRNVKVGSNLETDGSTFDGLFDAERLEVADSLFMRAGAQFKDVRLLGAKIGSNLETDGSTFDGLFDAERLEVADSLFMRGGTQFKEVRLFIATVGGDVDAAGSTFDGLFDAERLEVAGSLFMRDSASFKDVDLIGAVIGSQLQLRDSDLDGHLDLSGVSIGDELQLASPRAVEDRKPGDENFPPPRWTETSRLTLRNAHVGALNDTADAWNIKPGQLDLTGFTYERLGGLESTKDSAMTARSNEWLLQWLAKQDGFETTYNPQPFEQLAKVLRNSGYPEKAEAIQFAKRNHQRDSPTTPWLTKANLWIQWGLIGYGYNNLIALLWFLGLTGLGTWTCGKSAFGGRMRRSQRYWYSFDMALPLIGLNKRHEVVKLTGGVLVYFYFHKLAGFVLVSFLVAGLSGLTK